MEEMGPVAFARSRSRLPFGAVFKWIDNRESPRRQRRTRIICQRMSVAMGVFRSDLPILLLASVFSRACTGAWAFPLEEPSIDSRHCSAGNGS
jgi:hypothetical protein